MVFRIVFAMAPKNCAGRNVLSPMANNCATPKAPRAIALKLLAAMANAVPACRLWGTSEGCKRGSKCRFRDDDPIEDRREVTHHYSRHDIGDQMVIVLRVPLTEALQLHFKHLGKLQSCFRVESGEHQIAQT
jgi:hypothetical protein